MTRALAFGWLAAGCATVETDPVAKAACKTLHDQVAEEWVALVDESSGCELPTDCHAPFGACELGAGGCQEAVNVAWTSEAIEKWKADARKGLEAAGCEATVDICDCYGGYDADCVDNVCTLVYVGYD